jgi:hypothetical protein
MVLTRVQRARASMGGGEEGRREVRGRMELDGGGDDSSGGGCRQAVRVCPDSVRAASALNFTAHSSAWPSRFTASHEHAAVIYGSRRQHLAVPYRTRTGEGC